MTTWILDKFTLQAWERSAIGRPPWFVWSNLRSVWPSQACFVS